MQQPVTPQRDAFGSRRGAILRRGRALGREPSLSRQLRCALGRQARYSFSLSVSLRTL